MAMVKVSAIKTSPDKLMGLLQKARQEELPEELLHRLEKRLQAYEQKYGLTSEVFYERFSRGEMGDAAEIMSWAGDYCSYVRLQAKQNQKEVAVGAS